MEDHLNLVPFGKRIAGDNARNEFILVHVVGDIQIDQVGEFGAIGQIIDHDNIGVASLVEQFDEIAADKTSAACDYDHA